MFDSRILIEGLSLVGSFASVGISSSQAMDVQGYVRMASSFNLTSCCSPIIILPLDLLFAIVIPVYVLLICHHDFQIPFPGLGYSQGESHVRQRLRKASSTDSRMLKQILGQHPDVPLSRRQARLRQSCLDRCRKSGKESLPTAAPSMGETPGSRS
jgi:hypothetical protein